MVTLAGSAGTIPSLEAVKAVTALLWLQQRIQEIQATPPGTGVNYDTFPWDEWFKKLDTAQKALEKLGDLNVVGYQPTVNATPEEPKPPKD